MATAKNRRAIASVMVKMTAVKQADSFLAALPDRPKEEVSLREAIDVLQAPLQESLSRGYSYEDLVTMLGKQGLEISVSTLKRYLSAARKDPGAKPRTRRGRKPAGSTAATEQPSMAEPASLNGTAAKASEATTAALSSQSQLLVIPQEALSTATPAPAKRRPRAKTEAAPKTQTRAKTAPTAPAKTAAKEKPRRTSSAGTTAKAKTGRRKKSPSDSK